jgi:hypothetical protein
MAVPSISKDSDDNVYLERLDTEDQHMHMEKRVLRKVLDHSLVQNDRHIDPDAGRWTFVCCPF